ncbi:MAG: amidohydrolase family protein [Acidimicrobiia bacterium]
MPLQDHVQIVSVDDHVVEPPNVWVDRLPAKYKDRGPTSVRTPEGRDIWMIDGVPNPSVGLNAVAGKKHEEYGLEPTAYDDMRAGCYTIADRIADMDIDGIHAQLCFPSLPGFAGSTFFNMEDKELAKACVSAWNDWCIEEWCAGMPGRQIPLALVPYWDIPATEAEAKRVIEKGARTISFTEMPHKFGLPSYHTKEWDGFFAILNEAKVPLSIHFGSGGGPVVPADAPFTTAIAMYGLNSVMATMDLCNTRIFERFPNLKFALSEGGIGWMPYALERMDYTWERHRYYTGMADAMKPSEIFRNHIYGCFIHDEAGLHNVDRIGEDNIMFEGDYPHSDSNWPHARKMLAESLHHLPDAVCEKIAETNARKLFNWPRSLG